MEMRACRDFAVSLAVVALIYPWDWARERHAPATGLDTYTPSYRQLPHNFVVGCLGRNLPRRSICEPSGRLPLVGHTKLWNSRLPIAKIRLCRPVVDHMKSSSGHL